MATELVLAAGHRIRPVDLGPIAASGHGSVAVRRCPRVAILPTGTELVQPGAALKPGDIIEFNSLMLAAQIDERGGTATRLPSTPDNFELIKSRVAEALQAHDVVVVNAGSSAGSEDYTASVVAELGQLVVHGVAVRPGHPVVLGVCTDPEPNDDIAIDNAKRAMAESHACGVDGPRRGACLKRRLRCCGFSLKRR